MHYRMRRLITAMGLVLAATAAHAEDILDVYHQALQADPQLRAAEAANQAAQEAKPLSRSALLPQVNLGAGLSYNEYDITQSPSGSSDGDYDTKQYSLSLQQPVYHRDYFIQLKQADAKIRQANAELEAARQGLMVRVTQAYLSVLAAMDSLEFAQAEKKATEQQLNQTKQRFEVGLSAITDVHEAQAGYDAAVAAEIVARNLVDTRREGLREITNQDSGTLSVLVEKIPLVMPEPADIDAWVKQAQEQNLSLLAVEAATETARQEIERRRSGHFPTLDVVASHSYSDSVDSPVFGTERTDNSISLQLNVPLYSGGYTSASTREAVAQHTQAQEQLEQARRSATRQAREAYLNVVAGISNVQARKQAVNSANTALEATQTGFEVGTRTAVDVLNAQRELFGARANYSSARYDYILSLLLLKQATGSLSIDDLQALNRELQKP